MKLRPQFRLITLFAVTLAAALVAGWFGNRLRAGVLEDAAAEELARKGACVMLYEEGAYIQFGAPPWGLCGTGLGKIVGPSTPTVTFADSDMAILGDLRKICSIDFTGSKVTGSGVAAFKQANPKCHVTP